MKIRGRAAASILILALAAVPLAVDVQPAGKISHIGVLHPGSAGAWPDLEAFHALRASFRMAPYAQERDRGPQADLGVRVPERPDELGRGELLHQRVVPP